MITAQYYNVTGGRTIDFIGAGRATSTIKLMAGQTMTNSLFNEQGTRPVFRDLTIDMNNAVVGTPNFGAIAFSTSVQPTIRNVAVVNAGNGLAAIVCQACTDITVQNSYFQFTTASNTIANRGIYMTASTGANVGGVISDNVIINAPVQILAAQNMRIANNDISGFAQAPGFSITHQNSATRPALNNTIDGNRVHDSDASSGVFQGMVLHTNNSVISHNLVWNTAQTGMAVYAQNSMIIGNVAWDNNKSLTANIGGFQAVYTSATDSADGSVFQGNIAYDSGVGRQYDGYADTASLTNVRLISNQFSGATGAVRILSGTLDGLQLDKLGAAPTVAPGAGR